LYALAPAYALSGLKEKLGGLGVQVEAEGADHFTLRAVVAAVEAESMGTCEFCGAPGSVPAMTSRTAGAKPCAPPATAGGPPTGS
jgi:hypothetical protein